MSIQEAIGRLRSMFDAYEYEHRGIGPDMAEVGIFLEWAEKNAGDERPACICRPVTYAINPACPAHGANGTAPVRAYQVTGIPFEPASAIDHVTECYIFASSGYVNTCRPGHAQNSLHPYETATVTLNVGQRMIVERVDQGRMRLEVLPMCADNGTR